MDCSTVNVRIKRILPSASTDRQMATPRVDGAMDGALIQPTRKVFDPCIRGRSLSLRFSFAFPSLIPCFFFCLLTTRSSSCASQPVSHSCSPSQPSHVTLPLTRRLNSLVHSTDTSRAFIWRPMPSPQWLIRPLRATIPKNSASSTPYKTQAVIFLSWTYRYR